MEGTGKLVCIDALHFTNFGELKQAFKIWDGGRHHFFEGIFKENRYHGKGKLKCGDVTLEANYENGFIEGEGKYTYTDSVFVANHVKGQLEGKARRIFPDGRVFEETYKMNEIIGEPVSIENKI